MGVDQQSGSVADPLGAQAAGTGTRAEMGGTQTTLTTSVVAWGAKKAWH